MLCFYLFEERFSTVPSHKLPLSRNGSERFRGKMFLGTAIRNYLERFRNGSWIAAWNLGTVKNGSGASSWYSIFPGLLPSLFAKIICIELHKGPSKGVSNIMANHESSGILQECKNKYLFNIGKSQLTFASLCEHVSLFAGLPFNLISAELAYARK